VELVHSLRTSSRFLREGDQGTCKRKRPLPKGVVIKSNVGNSTATAGRSQHPKLCMSWWATTYPPQTEMARGEHWKHIQKKRLWKASSYKNIKERVRKSSASPKLIGEKGCSQERKGGHMIRKEKCSDDIRLHLSGGKPEEFRPWNGDRGERNLWKESLSSQIFSTVTGDHKRGG